MTGEDVGCSRSPSWLQDSPQSVVFLPPRALNRHRKRHRRVVRQPGARWAKCSSQTLADNESARRPPCCCDPERSFANVKACDEKMREEAEGLCAAQALHALTVKGRCHCWETLSTREAGLQPDTW